MDTRTRWLPLALCSLVAACKSDAPRAPTPTPPAPAVSAPALDAAAPVLAREAPAPAPPPARGLAALRERGTLHGEPLRVPGEGSSPGRAVVFLGTPERADAAWLMSEAPSGQWLWRIAGWPAGVRVLGGTASGDEAFVLIETLAVLGQVGGQRAVVALSLDPPAGADGVASPDVYELEEFNAFAGVDSPEALAQRVAALPTTLPDAPSAAHTRRCAELRAGAAHPATLVAPTGLDVFERVQFAAVRVREHLAPADVATSPHAAPLQHALRAAQPSRQSGLCGSIAYTVIAGHARLSGYQLQPANSAAPPPSRPGSRVASRTAGRETVHEFNLRFRRVVDLLGEAPLGAGDGSIAVALVEDEAEPLVALLREGGVTRVVTIPNMSNYVGNTPPSARARFADVDGDGRTDVVLRMTFNSETWTAAWITPSATLTSGNEFTLDLDSVPEGFTGDLEDVTDAILAAPRSGSVTEAEACALLGNASTHAAVAAVSTPDARWVSLGGYEEPPGVRAPGRAVRELTPDEFRPALEDAGCPDLSCHGMFCEQTPLASPGEPPPSRSYLWFRREGTRLLLRGYATYECT